MDKKQIILYAGIVLVLVVVIGGLSIKTFMGETPTEEQVTTKTSPKRTAGNKVDRKKRLADRLTRLRNRRQRKPKGPSDKGLVEVDAISDQLKNVDNSKDKIEILDQLWEVDDPALPKLVMEQLEDKNADVRLAAMELLDNKEKGEILDCIDKALDDPDRHVREFAVVLLGDAEQPQRTQSLLVKGVEDSSEHVRAAALDVIGAKSTPVQEFVFAQSIRSPYKDVKEMTVDLILDMPSHNSAEILFQGLNDQDGDMREYVNSKVDFLFGKEFKNTDEALIWWEKNKDKYDEELFEK